MMADHLMTGADIVLEVLFRDLGPRNWWPLAEPISRSVLHGLGTIFQPAIPAKFLSIFDPSFIFYLPVRIPEFEVATSTALDKVRLTSNYSVLVISAEETMLDAVKCRILQLDFATWKYAVQWRSFDIDATRILFKVGKPGNNVLLRPDQHTPFIECSMSPILHEEPYV